MDSENRVVISKPVVIFNIIVLCLIALLLLFLMSYPMQCDNPIFRILSAIVFIIIFLWRYFIIFICGVSIASSIGILKAQKNRTISPSFKIIREIIFLTFGLSLSTTAGLVSSMSIKSGKPDIDPTEFFSYFIVLFICYLIVRFGIGLLLYVRKTKS